MNQEEMISELLRRMTEAKEAAEKKHEPCPHCGACPHCGNRPHYVPYPAPYPVPYYPPQPFYPRPWYPTITYTTANTKYITGTSTYMGADPIK